MQMKTFLPILFILFILSTIPACKPATDPKVAELEKRVATLELTVSNIIGPKGPYEDGTFGTYTNVWEDLNLHRLAGQVGRLSLLQYESSNQLDLQAQELHLINQAGHADIVAQDALQREFDDQQQQLKIIRAKIGLK
jgi:hypothetical protein